MAGRGPAPKPDSERRRRNKAPEVVELVHSRGVHGPELPDGWDWPPETRTWWQVWRESPQAATFLDTDWSYLLDTARLHAEFWLGALYLEAGLRLRVAKFGATPEDRARLRMAIGEPPATSDPPAVRKPAARDRRRRLALAEDNKPAS